MASELKTAAINGAEIRYLDVGSGEPLLLLHGYPQHHRCWRHQIQALSKTHRVIAPDWLGWGESTRSLSLPTSYDLEMARLLALVDGLSLQGFNLAGHDYGGHLALGFAQRYSNRVLRLAILNSRAHLTFTSTSFYRRTKQICRAARNPILRWLSSHANVHAAHAADLRRDVPAAFSSDELEDYIGWMRTAAGRRYVLHFYRYYQLEPRAHLSRDMSLLHMPMAIIWGQNDRYCGTAIAHDLAARAPHAELTLIADAGHFVMEEQAMRVNDLLGQWLSGLTHPASSSAAPA